jgi:hypothetical protein
MPRLATYQCLVEPCDASYRDLLSTSLRCCGRVGLVIRDTLPTSARLHTLIRELEADLETADERNEWPGTRLIGGLATVYEYRWNHKTSALVGHAATGLYSWVQPDLPEDLHLYRDASCEPWMLSIAHEQYAPLRLTTDEFHLVQATVTDLKLAVEDGS